jgi:uncharacterized protein (DUF2461 family)
MFGEMQGERLTRTPKGFAADHPAADLLRFKQFLFYDELAPDIATTGALYDEVWQRFRAMRPFIDFLNAPLIAQREEASARSSFLR